MRRFRMRLIHRILLAIVLGALLVGFGFNRFEFVLTAIVGVASGLLGEFLWQQFEKEAATGVAKIDSFGSPEREKKKIEDNLKRIQIFAQEPEVLKRYTIAACRIILLHLAFAGLLGLGATLPQFLVKMAPAFDQSVRPLNVFISWLGMLSYVIFLLGIWHGYRLWRVHENVINLPIFERKCYDRLAKLNVNTPHSTPQSTS